jgi:DNA-binding XRE family transcriptional regulator
LNRIKNGRVKPTLVTALRIAHALGTSVNQLFYLEGIDADAAGRPPDAAPDACARKRRPVPERALSQRTLVAPSAVGASRR